MHTVGLLWSHRGEPPKIQNATKMNTEDSLFMDNGKVMMVTWKDKSCINLECET